MPNDVLGAVLSSVSPSTLTKFGDFVFRTLNRNTMYLLTDRRTGGQRTGLWGRRDLEVRN